MASDCVPHLDLKVRACNLAAKPELNGCVGVVAKYDEAKLRVGVVFDPPHGLLALKHTNVGMMEGGAAARSRALLDDLEKKGKGPVARGPVSTERSRPGGRQPLAD
jgi:hypothetical protein